MPNIKESKRFILKEVETESQFDWNIYDLLEEINRDRSEQWSDYDESDWEEGWFSWCEGDIYTLISIVYNRIRR